MLRASWFPGADPAARTQLLDDGAHGSFLSALMWVINGDFLERQPNNFRSRSRLRQRIDDVDHLGPGGRSRR